MGVATQCMKSVKCFRAKPQYYANVCLKSVRILWALVIVLLTTLQDQRQARWYQHNPGSSVRHRSDRPSKPDDCHGLANILWQPVPLLMLLIGADVIHPAPGSDGRPSFTALVANVDSDTAKYIATSRVQTSGREIINDLQSMSKVRTGFCAK